MDYKMKKTPVYQDFQPARLLHFIVGCLNWILHEKTNEICQGLVCVMSWTKKMPLVESPTEIAMPAQCRPVHPDYTQVRYLKLFVQATGRVSAGARHYFVRSAVRMER